MTYPQLLSLPVIMELETVLKYRDRSIKNNRVTSWGYRHQQCIILFFALTIAFSMRSCVGLSLVAMTDIEDLRGNNTADEEYEAEGFFSTLMLTPPYPKFTWSKKVQDTIISSFQWGYMVLQIPAGQIAHKYGARVLLGGAMIINCVVSVLLPVGAYYVGIFFNLFFWKKSLHQGGWICTVILRVIQGLSQGCIMPGIHTFLGSWAPLNERGRLTAIIYGDQALGTVLGLPISGFISASFLGWPGIFRFYGVLSGIIGVIIWWMLADTPSKHTRISEIEKKYIESGLGNSKGYVKNKMPVPWRKILCSRGNFAIIVAHISHAWGNIVLYSEVPSYMHQVMEVNIKANGLLTALPFLMMWIANFLFSWLTDMLIVKKILSVTHTRKVANSFGSILAGLGLISLAYVPRNIYVVETILVFVCTAKVAIQMGFQVNHIDIAPNFAGTMMSLSNFIANAIASLAPLATGFILTDVKSPTLWNYVFFLAAALYLTCNVVYVIFGTGERAEWNDLTEDERDAANRPMMKHNNSS